MTLTVAVVELELAACCALLGINLNTVTVVIFIMNFGKCLKLRGSRRFCDGEITAVLDYGRACGRLLGPHLTSLHDNKWESPAPCCSCAD
eukprot:SAG31_NODE_123_length_23712_cov_41.426291_8_plen_90_part_00